MTAALSQAGFTQEDLAGELRVEASTVSRWCRGINLPKATRIEEIDTCLGSQLSATSWSDAASSDPKLFLATPMASLSESKLKSHHARVSKIYDALEEHIGPTYWAGQKIRSRRDFEAPDNATSQNLRELHSSVAMIFLQLEKVSRPTSALIELGLALGLKKPCVLIIREGVDVPFMLTGGFEAVAERTRWLSTVRLYQPADDDGVIQLIRNNTRALVEPRH